MANFTEADLEDFVFYQDNETESLNSDSDDYLAEDVEFQIYENDIVKHLKFTEETNIILFDRSIGNFGHFVHFRLHGVKIFKRHKPIFCSKLFKEHDTGTKNSLFLTLFRINLKLDSLLVTYCIFRCQTLRKYS